MAASWHADIDASTRLLDVCKNTRIYASQRQQCSTTSNQRATEGPETLLGNVFLASLKCHGRTPIKSRNQLHRLCLPTSLAHRNENSVDTHVMVQRDPTDHYPIMIPRPPLRKMKTLEIAVPNCWPCLQISCAPTDQPLAFVVSTV